MNFNKLKAKRRAVSPIIAAILLIGLAVLAGAAIFLVVLPMLNPTTSASNVTASLDGTADTTSNPGTIKFSFIVSNSGLKEVNLKVSTVSIVGATLNATSLVVKSGGSDVTTTGATVSSGTPVTFTVSIQYTGTPTGDIKVTVALGDPVNGNKDFTFSQ